MSGTVGRERVVGSVLTPGDAGYDDAITVYNQLYAARPALVVRPVDGRDVSRVIGWAREEGYELAVKGGGHSLSGSSTCDDGLLLDLASLDEIRVDPTSASARIGGGVRAGAML